VTKDDYGMEVPTPSISELSHAVSPTQLTVDMSLSTQVVNEKK